MIDQALGFQNYFHTTYFVVSSIVCVVVGLVGAYLMNDFDYTVEREKRSREHIKKMFELRERQESEFAEVLR